MISTGQPSSFRDANLVLAKSIGYSIAESNDARTVFLLFNSLIRCSKVCPRQTRTSFWKYFLDYVSSRLLVFLPLELLTEEFCCGGTFPLLNLLRFALFFHCLLFTGIFFFGTINTHIVLTFGVGCFL